MNEKAMEKWEKQRSGVLFFLFKKLLLLLLLIFIFLFFFNFRRHYKREGQIWRDREMSGIGENEVKLPKNRYKWGKKRHRLSERM